MNTAIHMATAMHTTATATRIQVNPIITITARAIARFFRQAC